MAFEPKKILVRVPNWVGDAVLSLPALDKLGERFPSTQLTVLARPHVAGLYAHRPGVHRVHLFDHRGRHRGWSGWRRLAAELAAERFELAVLFQNAFQAALIASVVFSPDQQSTVAGFAIATAVISLPFSILGPFTGVFIDRWSRRRILVESGPCASAICANACDTNG